MKRRKKIYEGKAKILYKGPKKNIAIQYFFIKVVPFDRSRNVDIVCT